MTDIVERLRARWTDSRDELSFEAADEIERLKTERDDWYMRALKAEDNNERLRAALFDIAYRGHDNCRSGPKSCIWLMQVTARRALEPKP